MDVIVEKVYAQFKMITHWVKESLHMRYRKDEKSKWEWKVLTEGRTFLQAEGAELYYRNISVKLLD